METPSNSASDYYEIVRPLAKNYPEITSRSYPNGIPIQTKAVDPNLAIWAVVDGVLLVFILGGNILTILAVRFSRRLRSVISNMFVLSLAISDMLVGFTLPYHLAFYMGSNLGKSKELCLLRFFLIILACCNSIWNLIAIAVDRYIAIFYPLHYNRYMTKKVALILLGFGWILGTTFAMIPMFWNNWETATQCEFDEILKPWYIAGVITPGFSMVWVCMLIVYWRIWREASKHAKQLRSSFTGLHETPSDSKSVQVVLFILGCFSVCWLPYFVIACVQIFKIWDKNTPMLYKAVFSLAMANSGMNPIIYAWKNTGFRRAFARLLRCQSPDFCDTSQHSNRSNIHRKSSSMQHHEMIINASSVLNSPPSYFSTNLKQQNDHKLHGVCNFRGRHIENQITKSFDFDEQFPPTEKNPNVIVLTQTNNDEGILPESPLPSVVNEPSITAELLHRNTNQLAETNIDVDKINGGSEVKSALDDCRNLVIEKIECDGNGNTQIHIFRPQTSLKRNIDDGFELTLNCRNFKQPQPHVQFAQLYNGKHVISSTEKIQNEII